MLRPVRERENYPFFVICFCKGFWEFPQWFLWVFFPNPFPSSVSKEDFSHQLKTR
jgi:hypothetical protein